MKNWIVLLICSFFIGCSEKPTDKKVIQLNSKFTMEIGVEFNEDLGIMGSDIGENGSFCNKNRKKNIRFEIYGWSADFKISRKGYIHNSYQEITRLKKGYPKLKGEVFYLKNIKARCGVEYEVIDSDLELYGYVATIQKGNIAIDVEYKSQSDKKYQVKKDFEELINSIKQVQK